MREFVRSGQLSAGHARALVTLADPEAVARRIVEAGLNVREVEAIGETEGRRVAGKRAPAVKDADTRALEKSLSDVLGLAVTIRHKSSGGDVSIHYRTLEQLDDVCRRLKDG